MALYNEHGARDVARDLVKSALDSGAIKLIGPINNGQAAGNSASDAEYLTSLLKSIVTKLST